MYEETFQEKVILGEIAGKNAAIHAYDKIIWTIRSGYLTLVFAGWAVLLKSFAEAKMVEGRIFALAAAMFFVSLGLAFSGWFVDRNYIRRKFRVIVALNELMDTIMIPDWNAASTQKELLKVSGDAANKRYETSGYREALMAGIAVFLGPLPTLLVAAFFILS